MTNWRYYPVPPGFSGGRVDGVIASLTGLSRSATAKLCEEGKLRVDGVTVAKSERVREGQVLEVEIPAPVEVSPKAGSENLLLLYEDDDIVVVDKPVGYAAHPSLNFEGPDVLGSLMAMGVKLTTSGPPERKGIVHRLDVGTTGAMVVAKSEWAYTVLKQAFRDRNVEKIYHALVQGHPDPTAGTIDAPIGRDYRHQWKMGIRHDGRNSVTHYETLEGMAGGSLLHVHLETGRTHQIRVHMSATGHPCVGDEMYGADPVLSAKLGIERQWLHAYRLGFDHPRTGEWIEFCSPYPHDLAHALNLMRAGIFK